MKKSVALKTIAVILCAVSLFGIIGSGLSILALSETGLYSKTVDQLIDERVQGEGSYIARNIAARHASMELGGIPQELAWQRFPEHYGFLNAFGYILKDENGDILEDASISDVTSRYSYTADGQYIHLVAKLREPSTLFPERVPADQYAIYSEDGQTRLYSTVPADGTVFSGIVFGLSNGHLYDHQNNAEPLGTIHYGSAGNVICIFTDFPFELPSNETVTYLHILDTSFNLIYEAAAPDCIGYFTRSGNSSNPMFVSNMMPEPTVPEETEPVETIPETEPVETVPETVETIPEETEPQIEFKLEDNVPDDHTVEVTYLYFLLEDGTEFDYTDEGGIGRIEREDENEISFISYDNLEAVSGVVTPIKIRFKGAEDNTILYAKCSEGVGTLYHDDKNRLEFHSDFPEPVVVETEPAVLETEPAETVPETVETVPEETVPEETLAETIPAETRPDSINGKPLYEYEINKSHYNDPETKDSMYVEYVYVPMPAYTVELQLNDSSLRDQQVYTVLGMIRQFRQYLVPVLVGSIVLFLLTIIYLFLAAGHSAKYEEIRPGGCNRIPLDLYLAATGIGGIGLTAIIANGSLYLMRRNIVLGIACAAGCGFVLSLMIVGFLFACAAQFKTPGGFWYRNSLCGHFVRLSIRFILWMQNWLSTKALPLLGRILKKCWSWFLAFMVLAYRATEKAALWSGLVMSRIFRWTGKKIHRFLVLLPLTWQWLLVGGLVVTLIFVFDGHVLTYVFGLCVILYASHCFGLLAESTKRMSKGDLDSKVDDKLMVGTFQEFADDLNDLAGVAMVAAQKQLKSDRMKSELITNVSHDIKTPLTSIINYVDLLKKPHTEEEEAEYLEVLDRQSQSLKKLLDDLMDMSKANTGNMTVDIDVVDAVETINQALGEFSDKLEAADLTPVFRHTELSVPMMADGKLVWRILSNLLVNAIKYAMPGTRLYVDLSQTEDKVIISLKNISREELKEGSAELMERFVRGDDSRNTDGNGLGLNIARSLMELQHGQLELLVDGDLFKVTLIFPGI